MSHTTSSSLSLASLTSKKSGFIAGVINCMNLMIGGAILAMPYSASKLGYISFTLGSFAVMVLSLFTTDLLIQVCIKLKLDNYEEITNVAVINYFTKNEAEKKDRLHWSIEYSVGRRIVGSLMFITGFACVIGYGFIIKSQAPEVIKSILIYLKADCYEPNSWFFNGNIIYGLITIFITLPIIMAKNLDFLKYPSLIGMGSMIATIFILCGLKFSGDFGCEIELEKFGPHIADSNVFDATTIKMPSLASNNSCNYEPDAELLKDWDTFTSNINKSYEISQLNTTDEQQTCYTEPVIFDENFIQTLSLLASAWLSHAGVLCIFESLKIQTRKNMLKVTGTGYFICLLMYVAIGLCGYFTWNELTVSDILIMYGADNILIFLCRIFVDLTVLFSIPIVIFFGRKGFFSMVSKPKSNYTMAEMEKLETGVQTQKAEANCEPSNKVLYTYNIIFLAVTYYGVAFLANSIAGIFFLAGLICVCCGMILPPLIWIAVFDQQEKARMRKTYYTAILICLIGVLYIGRDLTIKLL